MLAQGQVESVQGDRFGGLGSVRFKETWDTHPKLGRVGYG